jgi:hypothetical protein
MLGKVSGGRGKPSSVLKSFFWISCGALAGIKRDRRSILVEEPCIQLVKMDIVELMYF